MNYRLLFKQKEYMKFIIANAVSRLGDSIDAIAFTWLVYEKTGSASWSAIIFGLNKLPTIFLQPFLGVLGDLLDRKQMILLSHLARFLSVCLIIYWLYIDNIAPVYLAIFTLLISTFEAINMPASSAFILEILNEDYYAYGNSFSSSLVTICELIGTCVAGVIIGVLGIKFAFYLDATAFLLTIFIESRINVVKIEKKTSESYSYSDRLHGGITYIKQHKFMLNFIILAVLVNAFYVPLSALQVPIVEEMFHENSSFLSFVNISNMAGLLAGAYLMPKIFVKYNVNKIVFTCLFIAGICVIVFSFGYLCSTSISKYIFVGIIMSLLGLFISILNGSFNTYMMKKIDVSYMARCSSILNACSSAAMPVSSFIVSFFVKYMHVSQILCITGILCLLVIFVLNRKLEF